MKDYLCVFGAYCWSKISRLIRRTKFCHLQKMDGSGDHHVKLNKLDSGRQVLHFLSYSEFMLKKRPENRRGTIWERKGSSERGPRRNEYDQSTLYTCMESHIMKPIILYN
jgi:hypothetical protein